MISLLSVMSTSEMFLPHTPSFAVAPQAAGTVSLYPSNPQPFALGILVKTERRERESISDKTEHYFKFSTCSSKCQIKVY